MSHAIRAVLFDIDDTLVDTHGAFRHALAGVAAAYVPDADAGALLEVWRADAGGWYRAHTRGEISHREQRMRRANDLHRAFGGPELDDEGYDAWNAAFERHFRAGWAAHPDAGATLDALDRAGVPYGALSNAAHEYQVLKLAACGLDRVPMLVGVDELGVGKPDPRVFHLACARLGFEPAEVVYVGDEFDVDGVGALDAGLGAVWLARPDGHALPVGDDALAAALSRGLVRAEGLASVAALVGA